jgi:membrane-associated phospholipid phosphatase
MELLVKYLDCIGFYGPEILFVSTVILLRQKNSLVTIYGIGFAVSVLLNFILKGLFKHPRPNDESHVFNIEKLYRTNVSFDKYGMPSGHAQAVFFTAIYTFLCLSAIQLTFPVLFFYIFIACLTSYQRVKYKHHTVGQVVAGAVVGAILAYLFYTYSVRLHTHK